MAMWNVGSRARPVLRSQKIDAQDDVNRLYSRLLSVNNLSRLPSIIIDAATTSTGEKQPPLMSLMSG